MPTEHTDATSEDAAISSLMATLLPPKGATAPDDGDGDGDNTPDADEDADSDPEAPEDADGDDDEGEDDDDTQPEETKAPVAAEAPDDAVVKVTVDGQEAEFTVASLKRLAGQEASLTKKSQEADAVGGRAAAVLQGSLDLVMADLSQYEGVDWLVESQRMDPDEFAWHRDNFSKAQGRYQQLVGAARDFEATAAARQQEKFAEEAAKAVAVLSDPTTGIPNWGEAVYTSILDYGESQGLPREDLLTITNPAVIKVLHQAMQFSAGKKAVADKINLAPKNVRKTSGEPTLDRASKQHAAIEKKVASGNLSEHDAVAALLGRWGVKGR